MTTVKLNRTGMRQLALSGGLETHLKNVADQILTTAKAIAPRGEGTYLGSFDSDIVRDDRVVVRVGNNAPHARFVEFGTSRMPAQRVLGRAAESVR